LRILFAFIFLLNGLWAQAEPTTIHLWHQMIYSHREVLARMIEEFEKQNPDIQVKALYRETEELRSSFQAASMAGTGPELVFGPSDQVGPFVAMGLLQPLENDFQESELQSLHKLAVIRDQGHVYAIGDSIGNHLMLIYNRKLVKQVPQTTAELLTIARDSTPAGGYGLVFNATEPFFFQPWISAFGEGFMEDRQPRLNTPAVVKAFEWIIYLKKQGLIPQECDYEMANALFKSGRAAFIINGDWSWGDYKSAGLDFGIAPLPKESSTGLWPSPLVSTRAYSLNQAVKDPIHREAALRFLKFMLSPPIQKKFSQAVGIFPSNLILQTDPDLEAQPLFNESKKILALGQPMPIFPEVRAVWDSLRSQYQAVLSGSTSAEEGAARSQALAESQIQTMNSVQPVGPWAVPIKIALGAAVVAILYFLIRQGWSILTISSLSEQFWIGMILPGFLVVFLVILYPFFYNLMLSFSNFSLTTFQNWEIVGFNHYKDLLTSSVFYILFLKTILWTVINVFFHTALGLILALAIDQTLPAKPLWRALLIIPWAVPQYITALTWRGMFNQEYGPINVFLRDFLHLSPVAWLTQPWTAFTACIITNVWLGFPFMMVVALGGLQAIPKEMYEASRLDGAHALARFRFITWPLLQPVLRPAMALGALWTFNSLNVVWLVSNGGEPADQTHILVSAIYKSAFQLYQYGSSAAGSVLIFLILLTAALFTLRRSLRNQVPL
jgi:arabinogalactan oligomer/maltooligosaccharide transport system permease protein